MDAYENSVANYDLPGLALDTTYYWQITATNGEENSAGPVWWFVVREISGMSWELKSVSEPQNRVYFGMAWDGSDIVIFSGALMNSSGVVTHFVGGTEGTCIWNGSAWSNLTPDPSPDFRYGPAMCFDNRGALLFGGYCNNGGSPIDQNDLWRYSGGTWIQLIAHADPGSPDARDFHAMVYDDARDVVILFGGSNLSGCFGDTWEFHPSNSSWVQKTTSPPTPRALHAMAYADAKVVMYGGYTGTTFLSDCKLWDGSAWSEGASIGPLVDMAMSGNADGSVATMFGGGTSSTALINKTWQWDGTAWHEQIFAGDVPVARFGHSMAYDHIRGEYLLFGGFNGYNMMTGTWVLK
jgi:hypothetical protein